VKLRGQCSLTRKGGHRIVRGDGDYQHRGGWELGLGDMANPGEPLQRRELKQAKGADKPEPKR